MRSVAHRFGAACAVDVNDIYVAGVRYDDDDPLVGDSLLARLRPGRLEPVARVDGIVRGVVKAQRGLLVLVGDTLKDSAGAVVKTGVVDVVAAAGAALALCGDDVVDVDSGATVCRAKDAIGLRGGVVRTAHGVVALDGRVVVEGAVDAAAVADAGVVFARGKELTIADARYPMPWPVQAIAAACGKVFVGSKLGGLGVVDEDVGRVVALRPSLRAHQLLPVSQGLVVVSDLLLATTDDGQDFISRDLTPMVRLVESA